MPNLNRQISVLNRDPVDISLRIRGHAHRDRVPPTAVATQIAAHQVNIRGTTTEAWIRVALRPNRNIQIGHTTLYAAAVGAFPLIADPNTRELRYMYRLSGIWPLGTKISFDGGTYTLSRAYDWSTARPPRARSDFVTFPIAAIPIQASTHALTIGPTDIVTGQANVEYPRLTSGTATTFWADLRDEVSGRAENDQGTGISVTDATFITRYDARLYADSNLGTNLTDDDGRTWEVTAFDRIGDKEFLAIRVRRETELS